MPVELSDIIQMPVEEKLSALENLLSAGECDRQFALTAASLLDQVEGSVRGRFALGKALGEFGDPRLKSPLDEAYWSRVSFGQGDYQLNVGVNLVTTEEWSSFVTSDRYMDDTLWTEAGRKWRDGERPSWQSLAESPEGAPFAISNQPVVGVSWYEANAYAAAHGARLLDFSERLRVVRGVAKRHYPWGSPFGHGNSNTVEEALGQPCAVGLFSSDKTPEGICDLAGNVAEWTADEDENQRLIHPGAWNQPAMASWPKASRWISAAARLDNLGFRIVRELSDE